MAITQLELYNDALLLLGQRRLQSLTEAREPRYLLDGAYNREAIRYCLELVQPPFASKTLLLNTPTAGSTFDNAHALPDEYISVVGVFSDVRLDQEIHRYVIEGRSLETDYSTVYLRYTSDAYALSAWDPSFIRVMGAYLALETATKLSTEDYDRLSAKFDRRVEAARSLAASKVPQQRPSKTTVTLTNAWRHVYNDALLIMGLDEITSNTDDSNRRTKIDRALDAGLVADLLEDTGWQFGQISTKIQYDPSAEPAWGYQRAIPKPTDLHRIDGVYTDEYMRTPLKRYVDETNYWFCDYDEIYLTYISTDYLVNPDNWPTFFKRLIAARIAKDTAPSLRAEGADVQYASDIYNERESSAKANDAMNSPPRLLAQGNWTKARFRGGYRGRPGDT
jgi:hypothetical protein